MGTNLNTGKSCLSFLKETVVIKETICQKLKGKISCIFLCYPCCSIKWICVLCPLEKLINLVLIWMLGEMCLKIFVIGWQIKIYVSYITPAFPVVSATISPIPPNPTPSLFSVVVVNTVTKNQPSVFKNIHACSNRCFFFWSTFDMQKFESLLSNC